MKDINKVTLVGNLADHPKITTGPQTTVARLRMATSERFVSDGETKQTTQYHCLVCFGPSAEYVGRTLQKSDRVFVEGANQTRSWEEHGSVRYITEIKVSHIEPMGVRQTQPQAHPQVQPQPQPQPPRRAAAPQPHEMRAHASPQPTAAVQPQPQAQAHAQQVSTPAGNAFNEITW